ncbi:hypothetical protein [Saccharothrix syringae]|uniref:Uncharacterized protein n=1 Tax=Saccharothrix syringae TaxID=103733 RepID=A0A5Q0H2T4_SACSY|nr:hypothetical protein [Saccharothrix syringae]QFZ20557.1 hypothetical protein EKG83_26930 [Saccharothrix syringae]
MDIRAIRHHLTTAFDRYRHTLLRWARRPVRIRVFHNLNDRALLVGYQEQPVTEVLAYTEPPSARSHDVDLVEAAFELCNVGDDPEFGRPDPRAVRYRRRGNRSLSIGDVVAVDGRFYACQRIGWRRITEPRQLNERRHGTTPLHHDQRPVPETDPQSPNTRH